MGIKVIAAAILAAASAALFSGASGESAVTPGAAARLVLPQLASDSTSAVTAPPSALGLSPFYTKYIDAGGIPIVGSNNVSDAALRRAAAAVEVLLAARPDVRAALVSGKQRVAIMAESEVTTDIPEHSDLYTAFPGTDWNTRARGLGGTLARPATSGAEENLLCRPTDRYRGENILVHEFSHTVLLVGVQRLNGGAAFRSRLEAAFANAIASGKWQSTYAATNVDEYWAEGVQDWLGVNLEHDPPDGVHNSVNTRAELLSYDPALAGLIREVFGETVWSPPCL